MVGRPGHAKLRGAKAAGDSELQQRPPADTEEGPRHILLFSDGTGNSSSASDKTNVWRLYEALDLGYPVRKGLPVQLAYYDNGVGTSSFKFLAALGGIFGFGLARNIRDIYKFLCRNYRPGDKIHAFGFSRGAYTIRLLVALIVAARLVPYRSELQLDLGARDYWREFRRDIHTNNAFADFLVGLGRWLVRCMIRLKRWVMRQPGYAADLPEARKRPFWIKEWWHHTRQKWRVRFLGLDEEPGRREMPHSGPDVEFVGVWDTVAAYGGPVIELTRAIDEWIWPLTMPDYRLSEKVKAARHALAIDDKRDSFLPLLWDEVHEAGLKQRHARALAEAGDAATPKQRDLAERFNRTLPDGSPSPRVQQVWFAGMHSDVGGGYADDSLAYVSLWWMIEHAELAGVRLLGEFRKRIESFRNIYGPIHDSRGGTGAFYRYQPRYINAWIDWSHKPHVSAATQIFRDPTIDRGRYKWRGLLLEPVRLHLSVEDRLRLATDGYGPVNLPKDYRVDDGVRALADPHFPPRNVVQKQADSAIGLALGDNIKLRRIAYFASFWGCAALAAKPYWPSIPVLGNFAGTVDVRTDASLFEKSINAFVPEFLSNWTHALTSDLFSSLFVVMLIAAFTALGLGREKAMTDLSRDLWRARFAGQSPPAPPAWTRMIRWLHKTDWLQGTLAWFKWKFLPLWLGLGLWLLALYAALAAATQLWLAVAESQAGVCPVQPGGPPPLEVSELSATAQWVDTRSRCHDLARLVKPDTTYALTITIGQEWRDGDHKASPVGWNRDNEEKVASLSDKVKDTLVSHGSRYFRRVTSAPLMAPILEVRSPIKAQPWKALSVDAIHMIRPKLELNAAKTAWIGTFTTPPYEGRLFSARPGIGKKTGLGRLHVFLNDAVVPFGLGGGGAQDTVNTDCPATPPFFQLCTLYANNHGTYTVTIAPHDPEAEFNGKVDGRFGALHGEAHALGDRKGQDK